MNKENFGFYEHIGIDTFLDHAVRSGMDQCPDMELCWPYLQNTSTLLEIGAGYGRCVEFLLKKGYTGKIYALEQSKTLLGHLAARCSAPNVIPVKEDLASWEAPEKMDAALWMWSGILDFSPEEQLGMIRHLHGLLHSGGILVIETPKLGTQTFGEHKDPQRLHVDAPYGRLDCYIPSTQEIEQYAKNAGFSLEQHLDYQTATDKDRSLFVLKKGSV